MTEISITIPLFKLRPIFFYCLFSIDTKNNFDLFDF